MTTEFLGLSMIHDKLFINNNMRSVFFIAHFAKCVAMSVAYSVCNELGKKCVVGV